MAQVLVLTGKSKVVNQLDTYNYTVQQAGMHLVKVEASEINPSGLSIVLQKNTVTQKSSTAPTPLQVHVETQIVMNCAVNDVIAVILSSSSAIDQGGNAVKAIINIHRGSN